MTLRRYAQRLLNPFRGIMNIIEFEGAEGVSVDGIHWDIYVRNSELVADFDNSRQIQTSDIRYGHWSEKQGLVRGPIFPSDDFRTLEMRGAIVYEDILEQHRQLPFSLQDHFECWLLDRQQQPLALLHTVTLAEDMELNLPLQWHAGQACQRSFHPNPPDTLQPVIQNAGNAGEYLTRYIRECSGNRPAAQWFQRTHNGNGQGLAGIAMPEALQGRCLESKSFPDYFLRTTGHDETHTLLIDEYLAWLAPFLLLLQNLPREVRQDFEQKAWRNALLMEKQFRLYPCVLDECGLAAARVEATLRARHALAEKPDHVLSTDYIELNDS